MKAANKAAILTAALLAATLGTNQCLADYEQGDIVVRIGWGLVDPYDDSELLLIDNSVRLPDTRVYVDDGDSATFTGTWLFADHFGLALLAALLIIVIVVSLAVGRTSGGPTFGFGDAAIAATIV